MLTLTLLTTVVFSQSSVADLRWLSGCWEMTSGGRAITEHWMPPIGGTMLGMSRTVSNDKTVEYEFLVLRTGDNGVEFVAHPGGRAGTVFKATRVTHDEAVFENPANDFPTRITYRKVASGVTATISGSVNGKARSVDFRYAAADCSK